MGLGLFVDERGYTSVAVVTALLASVAIVFCMATVEWTMARSADVQDVADAVALAGSNAVVGFCEASQALDACSTSLCLVGVTLAGSGLVMSAIPGGQEAADRTIEEAKDVIDARNRFAHSAAEGLRRAESMLPAAIVSSSWVCAKANSRDGMEYVGASVPFPRESQSDYGALLRDVDISAIEEDARRLQDATRATEEAKRRADDSRVRAWQADCVDMPRCMRSRAQSLAGLGGAQNPLAGSPESWTFGMAIKRSRSYYAARLAQEAPFSYDIEEVTDSLARRAFYEYALDEVYGAWYLEHEDGSVDLHVPHLARTSDEMRDTWLYTDVSWPCTYEDEQRVLHSSLTCPGATGEDAGLDCVASIDNGSVRRCPVCGMDVSDLGAVASISTIANNGYEHYWQIVVEEAQAYEAARNEQAAAERHAREVAEEGSRDFERALEQLGAPRLRMCPPGAWGCVGVAARTGEAASPAKLSAMLSGSAAVPAGAAASAATIVQNNSTVEGDGLYRCLEHLTRGEGFGIRSSLGGIDELWEDLFASYGKAFDGAGDAMARVVENLDGVFGGTVSAWLRQRVTSLLRSIYLEPARGGSRVSVLTGTQDVLGRAGVDKSGTIRSLLQSLSSCGSASEAARAMGAGVWDGGQGNAVEVAELCVPGAERRIPLLMDFGAAEGIGL